MSPVVSTSVCLPPAGHGACVSIASAPGIAVAALLAAGLAGLCLAAGTIVARYGRGEREIASLLARPIQSLVSAGVACLMGIALMAMALGGR